MTPEQCRAARGLVNLSQQQLAVASNVGLSTIKKIEKGETVSLNNLKAIQAALEMGDEKTERPGVIFIPANGGGPGVRLSKPSSE